MATSEGIRIPRDVERKVVKMEIAGITIGSRVVKREVVQTCPSKTSEKSGDVDHTRQSNVCAGN